MAKKIGVIPIAGAIGLAWTGTALYAQAGGAVMKSVFRANSISRITLESRNKPVERKLVVRKWFVNKIGKAKAAAAFETYFSKEKVFVPGELMQGMQDKYFLKTGNAPNAETWLIKDEEHFFIRHYNRLATSRAEAKAAVDIYSYKKCDDECRDNGARGTLRYVISRPITKFNPKSPDSFDKFTDLLIKKKVRIRNRLMREIRSKFFDSQYLNAKYPQDQLVTWCLFLKGKFIIRIAREPNDLGLDAYSVPFFPAKNRPLSMKLRADLFGLSTSRQGAASYIDVGVGFLTAKETHNKYGDLIYTNNVHGFAHIVLDGNQDDTYIVANNFLVVQRLGESWEAFGGTDFYTDTTTGILYGGRLLPGVGYNFLGFNNAVHIDPVVSLGVGYRHERLDAAGSISNMEESFNDIINSYRLRLGNIEYGYQRLYWLLAVEFQHTLLQLDERGGSLLKGIDEAYRIQLSSRIGVPVDDFKFFIGYAGEQFLLQNQTQEIINHRFMLSLDYTIQ